MWGNRGEWRVECDVDLNKVKGEMDVRLLVVREKWKKFGSEVRAAVAGGEL